MISKGCLVRYCPVDLAPGLPALLLVISDTYETRVVDKRRVAGSEPLQVVDIFDDDGRVRTYPVSSLEKVQ
jgi:hypothetical protein